MKTEKVILFFLAVVVGLMVAGIAFFAYQTTRVIPQDGKTVTIKPPSPTPKPSVYLVIDSPKDESATDSKTINISGKTSPDATIIISTGTNDLVVSPQKTGSFTSTTTIDNDQNRITITAIAPNGEETKKVLTITFSTENF